jgi:hypothetical protein
MDQGVTDDIQNSKQSWRIDVCKKLREVIHPAVAGSNPHSQAGSAHSRVGGVLRLSSRSQAFFSNSSMKPEITTNIN